MTSTCFTVFRKCAEAVADGKLIHRESARDKEYHFQNWCQSRLSETGLNYDEPRRSSYPDFTLVNYPEGYEIKGLEYPGRGRTLMPTATYPLAYIAAGPFSTYSGDTPKVRMSRIIRSLTWCCVMVIFSMRTMTMFTRTSM